MLSERRTELAGVATRVVEADGRGASGHEVPVDGAPLLFLHGFADTASTWRRLQRRLDDAGRASLAIDQPGHGRAARIDPDRPLLDQMVEVAAAAAASLPSPPVVVGNSLGGAHSLVLAARHPELVRAVVAISPAAIDHPAWMTRAVDGEPGAPPSRLASGLRRVRPLRFIPPAAVGHMVGAAAFGKPWLAPPAMRREWSARMRQPEHRASMREIAQKIGEEYLPQPLPFEDVRCPVLALWGDRDRLTLISSRAALEAGIADLEFTTLPGIGHMPQVEVPGRTTKHLLGFLRRLEAGESPAQK